MISLRPQTEPISDKLAQHGPLLHLLSAAAVEHIDPFFLEARVLDLQKVAHSSDKIIITVTVATSKLLLHLEEEVVV